MDTILFATVAAAGLIGWMMCYRNPRVSKWWRPMAFLGVFFLSIYLFFVIAGARLEWWNGTTMDRPVLALALLPVLAWPVRSPKPTRMSAVREVAS